VVPQVMNARALADYHRPMTDPQMARNTRLDMAWEYTNGAGVFSKASALELVTSNMDYLLGLSESSAEDASWVAYEGNPFALQATVTAVRGENRPYVHIF
jgi:hypothetical protein